MNNDKRTTRENAMLWWNNLGNAEKIKFWNKYPYMIPSFSTRLPKDLTGVEIERLYTAEHPTETESKGQEPEVDWLTPEESLAQENKELMQNVEMLEAVSKIHWASIQSLQSALDQERDKTKLLREALIEMMEGSEENPNVPGDWWQRMTPTTDALKKAKQALNQ